jgi:hypothetical protein
MGKQSVFDWDGLRFLENVFSNNAKQEHNWSFHYFTIRDQHNVPILMTFFCSALWKEDMLAPAAVSLQLEEKRKQDPYHLTSQVLGMGCLFTEGQHCFMEHAHPSFTSALRLLLDAAETLDENLHTSMLVLRDFVPAGSLNEFFHNRGFIKVDMPEASHLENLNWKNEDEYLATLSARSRKHFRTDIQPYEKYYDVECRAEATDDEIEIFYELYENVRRRNLDLNTFSFPKKLFSAMAKDANWEFIVMYLKKEYDTQEKRVPIGVMYCYKNLEETYVPSFIGMNYTFVLQYQVYRQLLYQTIRRAHDLNFKRIDFGMTAAFEKRKVGATIIPKVAYVQAKDNFTLELIGGMQNKAPDHAPISV